MDSDIFILVKVTWDGPKCYETSFEHVEQICCFEKKEDAEKAMRELASMECPEMVSQPCCIFLYQLRNSQDPRSCRIQNF